MNEKVIMKLIGMKSPLINSFRKSIESFVTSLLTRLKREVPLSLESQVKMVLFKTYFLSSFIYIPQILYRSQKVLQKLEIFRKRTTEWIVDINVYHYRFRALKLFPISYQLQMADLLFLNKFLQQREEVDVSTIINTKWPQSMIYEYTF